MFDKNLDVSICKVLSVLRWFNNFSRNEGLRIKVRSCNGEKIHGKSTKKDETMMFVGGLCW